MASGIALGGFAQGLSDGLQKGIRFVADAEKARRDEEKYQLEKPKLELEADLARRKAEANKQATDMFAQWKQSTFFDPDGNQLPPDQLPSQTAQLSKMFEFKTIAEVEKNVIDPETLVNRSKAGRFMKQENLMQAWEAFEASGGDQEAAFKAFSASGLKVPQGATIKPYVDKDTGVQDIGVFGPNGELITTRMSSIALMSADTASKMLELNIKERGLNRRQDSQNQTQLGVAGMQVKAAETRAIAADKRADERQEAADRRARENQEASDKRQAGNQAAQSMRDDVRAIQTMAGNSITAISRNVSNPKTAQTMVAAEREAASLAETFYKNDPQYAGRPNAAYADAQRTVYFKYGIPLPEPVARPPAKQGK